MQKPRKSQILKETLNRPAHTPCRWVHSHKWCMSDVSWGKKRVYDVFKDRVHFLRNENITKVKTCLTYTQLMQSWWVVCSVCRCDYALLENVKCFCNFTGLVFTLRFGKYLNISRTSWITNRALCKLSRVNTSCRNWPETERVSSH